MSATAPTIPTRRPLTTFWLALLGGLALAAATPLFARGDCYRDPWTGQTVCTRPVARAAAAVITAPIQMTRNLAAAVLPPYGEYAAPSYAAPTTYRVTTYQTQRVAYRGPLGFTRYRYERRPVESTRVSYGSSGGYNSPTVRVESYGSSGGYNSPAVTYPTAPAVAPATVPNPATGAAAPPKLPAIKPAAPAPPALVNRCECCGQELPPTWFTKPDAEPAAEAPRMAPPLAAVRLAPAPPQHIARLAPLPPAMLAKRVAPAPPTLARHCPPPAIDARLAAYRGRLATIRTNPATLLLCLPYSPPC
jgi:hypothetical protein